MKAALASRWRAATRRAADWCAHGLGLPAQRALLDWLVRLFFHAPPPGRPTRCAAGARRVPAARARRGVLQPR
jgi:cellulose synthase (UDP-forming)